MSIFYVDGAFIPADSAVVPATDLAVLRGFGAFDFLRTYGGNPFRLERNIGRLRRSCEFIGLRCPWSDDDLRHIILETLAQQPYHGESNIRIVVTGGISSDNITPDGEPRLIVMVTQAKPLPEWWYTDGAKVITVNMSRIIPRSKSTNYIPAIVAQRMAREQGGIEALYRTDDDLVTEGTTSNLFAFVNGTLVTAQDDLLPGITRGVILEVVEGHFPVEIRTLTYDELMAADEVFISAANKQIVPIHTIDDMRISDGVGQHTRRVMELFRQETERTAAGIAI